MAVESRNENENGPGEGQHQGDSNNRRRSAPGDDSAPSQTSFKRQRTALACNSCRTRKSRCDGVRPRCTMCIEMGLECAYQQPAAATGKSQPTPGFEGRLSSIEETLRLLVEENRRLQERQAPAVTPVSQTSQISQNALHVGLEPRREDAGGLRPSREDLQMHLPAEDTVDGMGAIQLADDTSSAYFGPSSNIAFIGQISHAMAAAVSGDVNRAVRDPRVDTIMSASRPTSPIGATHTAADNVSNAANIYTLPPEAEMLHLIRLFFSDTGMLFPYIHEGGLLETFTLAKRNNFTSVRRSWLCLLNVILAFATRVTTRPDVPVETSAAESDVFFQRAQVLSAKMVFRSTNLEIVQFLLLMTQYLQGTQRSAETWNLHGVTVKAALQLGLHTASTSTGFTPLESEIRKRTWYGCVILDRTLSMTFGRPPSIPCEFVTIDLPDNLDLEVLSSMDRSAIGPETSSSPSTVCFYIATIKLYNVLGDIVSILYGQNLGCNSHLSTGEMLEKTIKIEQRLASWRRELPPTLRLRPWDSTFAESDQNLIFDRLSTIITLRYLNVRILLHRQVLARFLENVDGRNIDHEEDMFLHHFGKSNLVVCLVSASEIISIVHGLASKRPYLLGAAWFTVYYTFNAALVVFAGLLVERSAAIVATNLSEAELTKSLQAAVEALHNLGGGLRLVSRCRRYLHTLLRVDTANNPQNTSGTALSFEERPQDRTVDFMGIPNIDETDLSPLGLDLGEFLTEDNLDFLTGLVGTAPPMFDPPIQGY